MSRSLLSSHRAAQRPLGLALLVSLGVLAGMPSASVAGYQKTTNLPAQEVHRQAVTRTVRTGPKPTLEVVGTVVTTVGATHRADTVNNKCVEKVQRIYGVTPEFTPGKEAYAQYVHDAAKLKAQRLAVHISAVRDKNSTLHDYYGAAATKHKAVTDHATLTVARDSTPALQLLGIWFMNGPTQTVTAKKVTCEDIEVVQGRRQLSPTRDLNEIRRRNLTRTWVKEYVATAGGVLAGTAAMVSIVSAGVLLTDGAIAASTPFYALAGCLGGVVQTGVTLYIRWAWGLDDKPTKEAVILALTNCAAQAFAVASVRPLINQVLAQHLAPIMQRAVAARVALNELNQEFPAALAGFARIVADWVGA